MGFNVTDQLRVRFLAFVRSFGGWGRWKYNETVHQLFTDFKKAYVSVGEFGVPMKLVRLIKMCLNEMYSEGHIDHICLIIFLSRMV
jgi:hypothetical protein